MKKQSKIIQKSQEQVYQETMIQKLVDDYDRGEIDDVMSTPPFYMGRILNRDGVYAKIFKDHRGQYYSRVDEKVTFLGDSIYVKANYRVTKKLFNFMIIDKYDPWK